MLASESACTVPIDSEHSPPIEGAQRFSNPVSTLCNLFRRAAASHLQLRAPGGVMHAFTRGGPPTEGLMKIFRHPDFERLSYPCEDGDDERP